MVQTDLPNVALRIQSLIDEVGKLIPEYNSPEDAFAAGNVALCIIDNATGSMYGKIWGNDKGTGRNFFKNAWIKSSQVWMTGEKTGEFEKKIYSGVLNEEAYPGLSKPDYIGWEGGQPLIMKDGTVLSVGFSGYRGFNDLDIVSRALEKVEKESA